MSKKKQTYVATFGEYSRGFGEAPPWKKTFEATSLEEAEGIAAGMLRDSNPDTYLVSLKVQD